jgi:hypothetical protein
MLPLQKIEQENKLLIEENNKKNIKLNTAENLYRLLADNSMHLVCLHDLNMTFQYISFYKSSNWIHPLNNSSYQSRKNFQGIYIWPEQNYF